jgi:hypothetical protein
MKYSVLAALALLISATTQAKDEDDEIAAVTNEDLLAVRTIQNPSGAFFLPTSPKRLVEAIQIDVSNSSASVCSGRVFARFWVPGDDEAANLAYVSAQPGESQNTYVVLPRPVLVDPAATEYPDEILLLAGKVGENIGCLVTVTVYSRPGPQGPPR